MTRIFVAPLLLLLLLSTACAGKNPLTIERPNARTLLEQQAYNLTLTSETILNTATECDINLAEGCEIADFMRPVLALLETIHNEARESLIFYSAFLDAGEDPSIASIEDLENLILSLERQIGKFVSGGGGE